MAVTYGFFNSVDGDRKYNTIQMSSLFDGIIRDGVFHTIGTCLVVEPNSGMTVVVGEGRAWFNHTWTLNDSPAVLPIDDPHLIYPRIDTIVLEVNARQSVRANSLKVVKGTPQNNPVHATLVNDPVQEIYQYALAFITVPVGIEEITNAEIVNNVGMSTCPYVTGPLTLVNIDDLRAHWEMQFDNWFALMQSDLSGEKVSWENAWTTWFDTIQAEVVNDRNSFEAAFAAWFDSIKGQLETDPAGHLQNEIDVLTESNNVLLATIVSTGANGEFDFDNIPPGYKNLRLVGHLKDTATFNSGFGTVQRLIYLNGDTGPNYAEIDPVTEQWIGWGTRTFLTAMNVVLNKANNAGYRNEYVIKFPSYDSSVTKKFAFVEELQVNDNGGNGNPNPTIGRYNYTDMWNSNAPITRIQLTGAYVADISVMRLYGCPY